MFTNVARKAFEVNRTILRTSVATTKELAGIVGDGIANATGVARDAGATVVGQTRSAVDRTVGELRDNAREVAGQARAQGERAGEAVDRTVDRTADRAIHTVEHSPSTGTPYEEWTKAELYDRAQELDIDGRSQMSKRQLIAALRHH
jgi:hypothetical protein